MSSIIIHLPTGRTPRTLIIGQPRMAYGTWSWARSASKWQRLYFRPLPHQQRSFRPSLWLAPAMTDGVTAVSGHRRPSDGRSASAWSGWNWHP